MGLAYDLNSENRPYLYDWGQIISQGSTNLIQTSGFPNEGRTTGITIPSDTSEFDVIIRDSAFVKDHYIIVGSYRAFFDNLNGGAGAYAWDGFVTIIRAHNQSMIDAFDYQMEGGSLPPLGNLSNPNFWLNPGFLDGFFVPQPFNHTENLYWTYLCRMPYEVAPNLTGLGSDSTPGIYSVDSGKREGVGFGFDLIIGGHQSIGSSEGGLTNQSYSAYLATLQFTIQFPTVITNDSSVPGGKTTDTMYGIEFNSSGSRQVSWKADQANHAGRYLTANQFPDTVYDTNDLAYSVFQTPSAADTVQLTTLGNGYVLTRVHDVLGLNAGPLNLDSNHLFATGEVAYDDGAGAIDFTTPFVGWWPYDTTPTYPDLYCAVGDRDWALDSSVAAYDLEGAYGTMMTPSFNVGIDPLLNQVLIATDRVTHGASTNGEIYALNFEWAMTAVDSPLATNPLSVWPFAVKGGPFETVGGYTLPDRWTGKAIQQRTFTSAEEATAKNLSRYPNEEVPAAGGAILEEIQAIEDRTVQQRLLRDPTLQGSEPAVIDYLSGYRTPNYQDYGKSNKEITPYQPANIAYGFMGYIAGDGPTVFMYDFGTITLTIPTDFGDPVVYYLGPWGTVVPPVGNPLAAGADILSVGSTMNDAIVDSPSDTDRRPLTAGWDVDRDQWIFTFGLNGAGNTGTILSCNSAFDRQPPNQVAYLDQTDQFSNLDSDQRSAMFQPRNMTPYLDGAVLFGGEPDYTALGRPAIPSILLNSYGGQTVRGFQFYIISGTTGRTARVWTDYLLFDGVDSLVAVELQNLGLRVTVENVEWYKAKILRKGELGLTPEEIEDWVRSQQTEYRETLKLKERQGRLRTRRRQQAAWREGLEDTLSGDFYETTGFENLEQLDSAAETFVPDTRNSAPKSGNKSREHSSIRKGRRDNKRNPE